LNHLKGGLSITPKDALQRYGSFRLAAHIEVLRKQGYPIVTEMVKTNKNEHARYKLEKE